MVKDWQKVGNSQNDVNICPVQLSPFGINVCILLQLIVLQDLKEKIDITNFPAFFIIPKK